MSFEMKNCTDSIRSNEVLGYKDRIIQMAEEKLKGEDRIIEYFNGHKDEIIEELLPIWRDELKKTSNAEKREAELAKGLFAKILDKFNEDNGMKKAA